MLRESWKRHTDKNRNMDTFWNRAQFGNTDSCTIPLVVPAGVLSSTANLIFSLLAKIKDWPLYFVN